MRIIFLVRSLEIGGAERQLVAVARGLRRRGHEVGVAVFYRGGVFEDELRADGIAVHDLRKRGRWETGALLLRLAAVVRAERADVLHAYMDANVFAAVARPLFPRVKVVWGIRSAQSDFRRYGVLERVYPKLERLVSRGADAVIVNSTAAARQAVSNGVRPSRVVVIPNGIDCQRFRPDPEGRERTRRRWGLAPGDAVVGMVARLDPVKDHTNFLRAASRVAAARPQARFVCVTGPAGAAGYREKLRRQAEELGLSGRLVWVDEGLVTSAVYSALDVAVLSSDEGESFPNVIGEAMACGRPCVVTDSGDAAAIVGDTGAVVPPRDPERLAARISDAVERLGREPADAGPAPRARIEAAYSLDLLTLRTEAALEAVTNGGRGRARAPEPRRGDSRCAG